MKWINVNKELPELGEYIDISVNVLVTDGKLIGIGSYDYDESQWTYNLCGMVEQVGNDIIYWMPLPELPFK
jgi:hypothetical protein